MPKPGGLFRSGALKSLRVVNVHQAKTHLSRLIDDAHAGVTIVLAKAGKPWARFIDSVGEPTAAAHPWAPVQPRTTRQSGCPGGADGSRRAGQVGRQQPVAQGSPAIAKCCCGGLSRIADPATPVLVSAATVWELSRKHHQGKLPEMAQAIGDLPGLLQADGFQSLPIALAHGLRAGAYTQPHRDPFDRMLAAQAELERLVLLTSDQQLSGFPCLTLW